MIGKPLGLPIIPQPWYRFVDETWVIQQLAHKQLFLDHINSIDPAIKFTVKGNQENGAIPFLDTLVKPDADNYLSIQVYHKPTHTDHYLQWDSHHNVSTKYSVIGTLTYRAKTVCTTLKLLNEELQHLREALVRCKYPRWAINKVQTRLSMATKREMALTVPSLAVQHKASALLVAVVKTQPPPGVDPIMDI